MRWRIQSGPGLIEDDLWGFIITRHRRSRDIRVRVERDVAELSGGTQEALSVDLVNCHLNDHVPPDEMALVPGWDYERQQAVVGEMGFTQIRGLRMRCSHVARRLNLPHWLHPRS